MFITRPLYISFKVHRTISDFIGLLAGVPGVARVNKVRKPCNFIPRRLFISICEIPSPRPFFSPSHLPTSPFSPSCCPLPISPFPLPPSPSPFPPPSLTLPTPDPCQNFYPSLFPHPCLSLPVAPLPISTSPLPHNPSPPPLPTPSLLPVHPNLDHYNHLHLHLRKKYTCTSIKTCYNCY